MMKMSSASTANLTPVTLRFGVFFDGTGNNLHNATAEGEQGDKGGSYGNALSNVALLHALYPADAAGADGPQAFLKRYVEGVGTLAGEADHVYASATGHGRTGAEARVAEALQGMAEQLRAWRQAHPQATLEGVEFDLRFQPRRGSGAASGQPAARWRGRAVVGGVRNLNQLYRPVRHRGGDHCALTG